MLWNYDGSNTSTGTSAASNVQAAQSQERSNGIAALPNTQAAPASGGFYDPARLAAAMSKQGKGADGRTILSGENLLGALNPISAPKWVPPVPAGTTMERDSGGDYVPAPAKPGYFLSSNGTILNSPDGGKTFSDIYDNPGGASNRDKANITYRLSDDGKTAIPTAATSSYQPGDWVNTGQDLAKWAAVMASAGTAGAAMAGGGAAAGGAAEGAAAGAGTTAGGGAAGAAADFGAGTYAGGSAAGTAAAQTAGTAAGAAGAVGASAAPAVAGGVTQLAPVTITGAAPAAAAGSGLTLGQVGGAASAASAAAGAGGSGGGTSPNGMSSGDRAAMNSNTGYTGSSGGTGSSISDMASQAGQSVGDYLKTPAGAKAALALAGAAIGSARSGGAPVPISGGTIGGSGIGGSGGTVGDVAGQQLTLAQQNAARTTQLQGQSDPLYSQLIASNAAQAGKLAGASDNQFAGYKADFAPIEQKYAQTALNYDTPGRREQEAQIAVADQANRFSAARDERNRNLSANGVDPSSGKALAFDSAAQIEQARAEAGSANSARKQVEQTGLGLMQSAANFGQQKLNTGLGLANAATTTGNAAAGLANQQQSSSNNTAQTDSGLLGNVTNSLGTQANINNGLFSQNQTAYENKNAQTADWLGAAGQVAGSYFSSKQLKNEVGGVDKEKAAIAVASTPIHAWTYKPGAVAGDDGSLKIGKYAEDSQAATGLGDGTKLDAASENGLNQATLQYLLEKEAKRDPKLRKKLAAAMAARNKSPGLADARRMG